MQRFSAVVSLGCRPKEDDVIGESGEEKNKKADFSNQYYGNCA